MAQQNRVPDINLVATKHLFSYCQSALNLLDGVFRFKVSATLHLYRTNEPPDIAAE